jgi:phage gp37-like protein
MPIEFWTSLERDLVVTKWWGEVSLAQFRQTFGRYLTDVNYHPGRTELIDFSGVTTVDVGFKAVWSALTMVNNQVPGRKVRTRTVLIAPGEVIYGLSRMYQTLAQNEDGIQVEVYRTQQAAFDALELSFETVDALLEAGGFLPYTKAPASRDVS